MYKGAGLGPADVDVFNPYDGYAPMAQFFLEAFQWRAVKRGDAFAFYAGDIRSRGRTRSARAAAIWETGAPVRPCTPTGSSSSAARQAHGRSGFGQRLRWRRSPLQAMAAGSCSASPLS